jgi:hypothetical protein
MAETVKIVICTHYCGHCRLKVQDRGEEGCKFHDMLCPRCRQKMSKTLKAAA